MSLTKDGTILRDEGRTHPIGGMILVEDGTFPLIEQPFLGKEGTEPLWDEAVALRSEPLLRKDGVVLLLWSPGLFGSEEIPFGMGALPIRYGTITIIRPAPKRNLPHS